MQTKLEETQTKIEGESQREVRFSELGISCSDVGVGNGTAWSTMWMNGSHEVGVPPQSSMVERAIHRTKVIDKEGVYKVLKWAFDFGEGEGCILWNVYLGPPLLLWNMVWRKVAKTFKNSMWYGQHP